MVDPTNEAHDIRLGDVRRLDLKRGDILAVTLAADDQELAQLVVDSLTAHLEPLGVQAAVFPPGTEITVLRHEGGMLRQAVQDEIRRRAQAAMHSAPGA